MGKQHVDMSLLYMLGLFPLDSSVVMSLALAAHSTSIPVMVFVYYPGFSSKSKAKVVSTYL